jgi:uncharacterized protein (DUF1800 family)
MMPAAYFAPKAARFVAAATALVLAGGVVDAQRSAVPARADARTVAHVLDRMSFGARPGDVARVQQTGLAAYIEQQLHPARIADGALASRLSEFTSLNKSAAELAQEFFVPQQQAQRQIQQMQAQQAQQQQNMAGGTGAATGNAQQPPPPPPPTPEMRMLQQQQQQMRQMNPNAELVQAKVLRAVLSERQLEEVLVDFWFNHFNVFVGKGQVRQYIGEYEREAIRPHVLGTFREMLGATAKHPAMLFYLDNFQSRAPNVGVGLAPDVQRRLNDPRLSPQQRQQMLERLQQARPNRQQGGLNENYARELMELHTLGVDGGYTQQDVVEVARILTGWTIDRPQQGGSFVFRPQMHDTGKKVVLGKTFDGGGQSEGERLLDMLAAHPATARHVAFKLAQRFIADNPPAALVDRVAKRFTETKGNLREVTRAILTSREFFDEHNFSAKTKTPLEYVISAVRATNANVVNAQPIIQALQQMGMPLYGAQPPTGYSMTADAWVNTGALLARMNFATLLVGLPQRPGPGAPQGTDMAGPGQRGRGGQAGQAARPLPGQGRGRAAQQLQRQAQAIPRGPLQVDVHSIAPDTSAASVDRAIELLLGGRASDGTKQIIARAENPQQLVALVLGSPEFQKR